MTNKNFNEQNVIYIKYIFNLLLPSMLTKQKQFY